MDKSSIFFLLRIYILIDYCYLKFPSFFSMHIIMVGKLAMKLTAMGQFSSVLLACCMQAVICSSIGNYTDMFSLLDFKKQISLDPKQALMSWNDSTHFCSWKGVRCSVKKPSRVTSLNLTKQGLVGQISPSLGNLMKGSGALA